MRVLRGMVKVHMLTIIKQTLRYKLGVSHIRTLTNNHKTNR
jgi:hypothetical protein